MTFKPQGQGHNFIVVQPSEPSVLHQLGRLCCNNPFNLYNYRVIQEESAILWEMIVCVILSKKVHMNMGPILNGYRDMVKRRYEPSCEHEQQLCNK